MSTESGIPRAMTYKEMRVHLLQNGIWAPHTRGPRNPALRRGYTRTGTYIPGAYLNASDSDEAHITLNLHFRKNRAFCQYATSSPLWATHITWRRCHICPKPGLESEALLDFINRI